MTPEEQFAELFPIAKAAARAVYSGNRDYVDVDDLTQEAMLWLLEHPKRVSNHTLPDGHLHFLGLLAEVAARLRLYIDKERLEARGYEPVENYKYSARLVELVLPGVFDPSYRPPGLDNPDRVTIDPEHGAGANWATFVTDVRCAIDAVCSKQDRRVLFERVVEGWTWAEFGKRRSQSEISYRRRYHAAVDRICAFLSRPPVVNDSPDAGAMADALSAVPHVVRAQTRTDWHVTGKDRYVEPDL